MTVFISTVLAYLLFRVVAFFYNQKKYREYLNEKERVIQFEAKERIKNLDLRELVDRANKRWAERTSDRKR